MSVLSRLVTVFRSRAVEEDLDEELQAHIDMLTDSNLASGMLPEEARRQALVQFGNRVSIKEEARGFELSRRLESLGQDLRYGTRILRKNFGFTTLAVLMLGLGIGMNTAILSVFVHLLLTPLQFDQPNALYVVSSQAVSLGDGRRASSGPDFRDFRAKNIVFSDVAAVSPRFSEVWTGDGEPRVVSCVAPSVDFFRLMGIVPVRGRVFVPEEYHDLRNSTVLISWKFWRGQLGDDPQVIGRTIRIEDVDSTIVGVLPPLPDLYSDVDIWMKLTTEPSWEFMNWRANKFLDVIGRLKPGISRGVAEEQLTSVLRKGTGEPDDVRVQLTPLKEFIVGPVTRPLNMMMAAVGLVLLVTCLNTAAILLARSVKRAPEFAVRLGLGGSHGRIRQQLLVEGLLLSAAGGALGILLASFALDLLRATQSLSLPRLDGVHLNLPALAFGVVVVLLTSVAFTLLPANMLATLDIASGFRGGRTETGSAHRRPFAVLVIAEIACAVVLTVVAGLLLRSFIRMQSVELGFEPRRVLAAYLRTNYESAEGFRFWHEVLDAAGSLPGAASAAVSDCVPTARANQARLVFADRPNDDAHPQVTDACWVSPDYFGTLGVPLLHGRMFSEHDGPTVPPTVILNQEAAERFFPGQDPLGKRFAINYLALGSRNMGAPRMREVIGVVSNLRQRALALAPAPAVYLPYTQDESYHVLNSMELYVRASGDDPSMLGQSLRSTVQGISPNQPVERIQVLQEVVDRSVARQTYSLVLMGSFAVLALALCALGIYGVVSYVTQQRTREFGIRMALGATRGDVIIDVMRQGAVLVGVGAALGVALSLAATRALSHFLFETTALDPLVFIACVILFATVGMVACLAPAVRASQLQLRAALSAG